ncbi:hypothetical protein G3T36_07465 [Diaminobutyricibacter tongyongensis]|uniref:Helix-turn-helix domain-containing protein n=1 Tax=Leifsonia tongyongensis TaxID=1268043 RepID=A0A6L9XXG5_9MICO|nr:hypothetical protein [Diaminobutyricibacter tongyongensis]NEN05708.1 hypothetical protein [Diaminobutyricibacter tongyongensis]
MTDSHFSDPGAWIAAVDRALERLSARHILAAKGIEPATFLAIVRAEASGAGANGITILSHEQLAQLTGVSRPSVLRARLALIELGLEYLAADSGASGKVHRILHMAESITER